MPGHRGCGGCPVRRRVAADNDRVGGEGPLGEVGTGGGPAFGREYCTDDCNGRYGRAVRGQRVLNTGSPITVPVGRATLGRIVNVIGEPIDDRGDISSVPCIN